MPEIDWNLDSSVGDHKITSSHIALLIGGRFKTAIQDTLVLPNCEIICIPWMLAEKDDWAPRSAAPFVWIRHQDAADSPADKPPPSSVAAVPADDVEKKRGVGHAPPPPPPEPVAEAAASRGSPVAPHPADNPGVSSAAEELRRPLLMGTEDSRDGHGQGGAAASADDLAGAIVPAEQAAAEAGGLAPPEEDGKPRKIGRRARMMDLGKKMSEKLEEKRRHLEEKSRHIVEKMRENARQQQQQQPQPPPPS